MRFEAPTTTKAAAELLVNESGESRVLAGGTDLLVRMKTGTIEPDLVVDIKRIESLQRLNVSASGTEIGSAVPAAALGESTKLKSLSPVWLRLQTSSALIKYKADAPSSAICVMHHPPLIACPRLSRLVQSDRGRSRR